MNKLFLLLLLFKISNASAQRWTTPFDDSVMKANHVKMRIQHSNGFKSKNDGHWMQPADTREYYNRSGTLSKIEILSQFDYPFMVTEYFYDSIGRLYATVTGPGEPPSNARNIIYFKSTAEKKTTYYFYDDKGRLRGSSMRNASGQVVSEEKWSYDPKICIRKFNSGNPLSQKQYVMTYENDRISSTESKTFDSTGALMSSEKHRIKNKKCRSVGPWKEIKNKK